MTGRRPNMVLVLVDDMGFSDLGCMGFSDLGCMGQPLYDFPAIWPYWVYFDLRAAPLY